MELFNKKIVNDSAFLSVAGYLNQFFSFIRGFLVARLLDPTLFGYLSGARLILQLTPQMHLGALHGMTRELSIYKGAKDKENFQSAKNNGISLIIVFSTTIVLGIIIYTFFVQAKYSPYTIWGIRVFAIVAFIQQLISIFHALLRADYRFAEISTSGIILGFSSLFLAVLLVIWFGFYGAILSFFIAHLLPLGYLAKKIRFNFKFEINTPIVKKLLLVGAPISFFFFNSAILGGLDKLMIISFLSAKQLGYYAVAFPFFTLLTRTTHSISYIVYPKMLEAYGNSLGEIGSTKRYFEIPSQINACFVAFGIGLLFLSVKYIIFYFLPQYMEAIPVARILSFAIYFSSLRMLANRVLITQKSYKILFIFYGVAIFANILLNFMLIKMGYGIKGVAAATGISYVISCSLSLHYTLSHFYKGLFEIMANQLKLYWPILYVGLILLGLTKMKYFHVDVIRGLSADILQLTISFLVFTLLTIPLFILANRKLIKKIMT